MDIIMNSEETKNPPNSWSEIIQPRRSIFDLRLKEVWNYRDLLGMFVKRDFLANYKQTILGPLWFFIQQILTTIMFTLIFGKFAGLKTDGLPAIPFYLAGLTIWNYFSECFNKTSGVFLSNASIFGKVYFPRLILPLSIVVSGLMRLGIQFIMLMCFLTYYLISGGTTIAPNLYILLTPLLILIMAGYALGAGMIFSALTTKYRDLSFLLSFGVQLLMYSTPIIYSVSGVPEKYKSLVLANPLSSIVETFRYAYLGTGYLNLANLGYSFAIMLVVLASGVVIFNKVEQSFMDTV
jgi:lipopolysaccharide transport system permease protein